MEAKDLKAKLVNIALLTESTSNTGKSIYKKEFLQSMKQKSDIAKRNFIRKQIFLPLAKKIDLAFRLNQTENKPKLVQEFDQICSKILIDTTNKPKFSSEKNSDLNSILIEAYDHISKFKSEKKENKK